MCIVMATEMQRPNADLIALQCTVQKFEKGSEKMRQVTTVAGATSITLRCQFRDKAGNLLLERNITGKVRFFGGNLKATYDFAKKAANIAAENFLPSQSVVTNTSAKGGCQLVGSDSICTAIISSATKTR